MPDWGRHGAATFDLWDRLFREIVEPTASFASGVLSPTVRFLPPFVQKNAGDPDIDVFGYRGPLDTGGPSYSYRDQVVIEGGPACGITPSCITYTNPDGTRRPIINRDREVEQDAALQAIWPGEIHKLMYPWQFYALGQQYLARLVQLKPARTASIEHRMIWAVDAAWWINQMLGATNVYPSWIPDAMGKILGSSINPASGWGAWDFVPGRTELAPVLGLQTAEAGFYPLPFAVHPGQYNTSGLIKNPHGNPTYIDGRELAHIRRWVESRPWWLGIQTYGDFASTQARAAAEDPHMHAHLLRACMQHSFFQFPEYGTATSGSFFDAVRQVQVNSRARDQLETFTDTILPAWLTAMQRLPYWSLVRAGYAGWNQFSSGALDVSLSWRDPVEQWRFPYTSKESRGMKAEWERAKDDAVIAFGFSVYFTTWWALLQTAVGNIGSAQLDAVKAWYAATQYRYKVPKSWEKSWEPPPVVMRMISTSRFCLMPPPDGNGMCSTTAYGPDARVSNAGYGAMYAAAAQHALSVVGGIALTRYDAQWFHEHGPVRGQVAAFERATDVRVAPPPTSSPSEAPVVEESSTQWSPTTFSSRKKSFVPYVVGGIAAVVGIIVATRNRRK